MTEPRYSVEQELDPDYLRKLGVYVQTCARIELTISNVICALEKRVTETPEYIERRNELRSFGTRDLISAFGKTAAQLEKGNRWRPYISELTGWLHRYHDARHLAIHGVHVQRKGTVRVNARPKGARVNEENEYSMSEIDQALKNADDILTALMRFYSEIG